MNIATKIKNTINVTNIPNLDFASVFEVTTPLDGMARIILPSGHLAYHLTKYQEVQQVLMDKRFIRSPCNEEGGASFLPTITPRELLLNNDAPHHARLRKVVVKDFSPSGVAVLKDKVVQLTHARLDEMIKLGDAADLFSLVLDHIPSELDCYLMGIPLEDRAFYRPLTQVVQIGAREDIPELLRQFWLVYHYLMDLVTGRRASYPDGLIQRFVADRDDSTPSLTDEELVGVLLGVLIGGDQNILSVMTKVIYALLAAPTLWQSLVEDPALIPCAVEELLRLIPIGNISTFPRIASADVEGSWGKIECGSVVYADVHAANRDPSVFPDPLTIQLNRNNAKHLQFGYGMHNCMGAALARMEISTVLEILIERIPSLQLAIPAEEVPWVHGTILRRPTSLPVRWAPFR